MYFFKDRHQNTQLTNDTMGLDIGSAMLKWVIFGPGDVSCELKNYAIAAIPKCVDYNQKKDASRMVTILKRTLLEKTRVKNCVLNMPDHLVCSKWIQIDHSAYENLDEIIAILAERSIPYPLKDLYFDYQSFSPAQQDRDNFKVLLVACRKEQLDFRLDIIHQANLIPIAVELNSQAIVRANYYFYPENRYENRMFLEVGANQLTLLFLDKSKEAVCFNERLLNTQDKESILLQIKRCIKRYFLAFPDCSLHKLFFIGFNRSLLRYLIKKLDGFLALNAQILDYEQTLKCSYELNKNKLVNSLPGLFISCGLALSPYQDFSISMRACS
jgi:type IV pilus assembly protein PilM